MILSILDIKKTIIKYIFFTIFILIFGLIYEHFSFGVKSNYMLFAFLIPLILGILINIFIYFIKIEPTNITYSLYNNGVITLTIGSIINGIIDIYGTTNSLIYIYLYVGIIFIIISLILYLIRCFNG